MSVFHWPVEPQVILSCQRCFLMYLAFITSWLRVTTCCERAVLTPLLRQTHQPRYYMHSQALTAASNAACLPISRRHMVLVSTCSFRIWVCHKAAHWDVFIWAVIFLHFEAGEIAWHLSSPPLCVVFFTCELGNCDGFVSIFTKNLSIN